MVILPFVSNYIVIYLSIMLMNSMISRITTTKTYPSSLFAEAGRVPVMCSHRREGWRGIKPFQQSLYLSFSLLSRRLVMLNKCV